MRHQAAILFPSPCQKGEPRKHSVRNRELDANPTSRAMKFIGASSIVLLASFAPASYAFSFFPSSNIQKQQLEHSRSFITKKSFGRTLSSTGSTSGDIGKTSDETDKEGVLIGLLNGFFKRQEKQLQQQSSSVNAKDIIVQLVRNRNCYSTVEGAKEFAETCADDIIYEDCYLADPVVGKKDVEALILSKVKLREGKAGSALRLDRISDGKRACGFAWTWISNGMEGLRGTTFVEFNDAGRIVYVREVPEPLFKPGDLTVKLLEAATKNVEPKPKNTSPYKKRRPIIACDIVKYLFNDVQGSDIDESMNFFDQSIVYHDFNFEHVIRGKDNVRKFIEDFSFPGIEFKLQKVDDGTLSSSFTWQLDINGVPGPKGVSLYELNPASKLISYVRDIPESAIKPPPLGALARFLRPGLGVFQSVTIGTRDDA